MSAYPRRDLRGNFATAVRSDGWRDSDVAGQAHAVELASLGATGVYVNAFGVAFGSIDGTAVLLGDPTTAVRYQREFDNDEASGFDWVTADDDWTHAVVMRVHWSPQAGGFLRVARIETECVMVGQNLGPRGRAWRLRNPSTIGSAS